MTLHTAGMKLTNTLRPAVAGVLVVLRRAGIDSLPFYASSPPIGHAMLTELGLALSEHDRVFFWELTGDNMPQRGDTVVDPNGVEWSIRPPDTGAECWRWHGSNQSAVMVVTKRDG